MNLCKVVADLSVVCSTFQGCAHLSARNCVRVVVGAFLSERIYLRAIVGALLSCALMSGHRVTVQVVLKRHERVNAFYLVDIQLKPASASLHIEIYSGFARFALLLHASCSIFFNFIGCDMCWCHV